MVMKKSIGSVFLMFAFLTVLLNGCAPASTPIPPVPTATHIAIPTATNTPVPPSPTVIPETDIVTGRVYLFDTNEPIKIEILLLHASSEGWLTDIESPALNKTTTDTDGQYTFHKVEPGTYVVAVTGKGSDVAFCGTDSGNFEEAVLLSPTWYILYMKPEDQFTVSAGGIVQQDIAVKCQ